jgi:hypothetical protein
MRFEITNSTGALSATTFSGVAGILLSQTGVRLALPHFLGRLPRVLKCRPRFISSRREFRSRRLHFENGCRKFKSYRREFFCSCPQFESSCRVFQNSCRVLECLCPQFFRPCPQFEWSCRECPAAASNLQSIAAKPLAQFRHKKAQNAQEELALVGRVAPRAPFPYLTSPGAHGVTRPTLSLFTLNAQPSTSNH